MQTQRPITFKGDKISLVPPEQEDALLFYEWMNDQEVLAGLTLRYQMPVTMEIQEEWYSEHVLDTNQKNEKVFAIMLNRGKKVIGNISYRVAHPSATSADIGIVIGDKKKWDKGYGGEAVVLLLNYLFNTLNFNSVTLTCFSFNKRAIAAYKKIGFKVVGRHREKIKFEGHFYHEIHMDILAREFQSMYTENDS